MWEIAPAGRRIINTAKDRVKSVDLPELHRNTRSKETTSLHTPSRPPPRLAMVTRRRGAQTPEAPPPPSLVPSLPHPRHAILLILLWSAFNYVPL